MRRLVAEVGRREQPVPELGRREQVGVVRRRPAQVAIQVHLAEPADEGVHALGHGGGHVVGRVEPEAAEHLQAEVERVALQAPVGEAVHLVAGRLGEQERVAAAALDRAVDVVGLAVAPEAVERGVPVGLELPERRVVGFRGDRLQQPYRRGEVALRDDVVAAAKRPRGDGAEHLGDASPLGRVLHRVERREVLA